MRQCWTRKKEEQGGRRDEEEGGARRKEGRGGRRDADKGARWGKELFMSERSTLLPLRSNESIHAFLANVYQKLQFYDDLII